MRSRSRHALGVRFLAPTAAPERYLAVLQDEQKAAGWVVEIEARGRVRLVPLAATPVPPQRALQFWTKAPSATAPTSLGLVPGDRVAELPPPGCRRSSPIRCSS